MSRVLLAVAALWAGLGSAAVAGRGPDVEPKGRHVAAGGLTTGTFSLARGVIGGLLSGQIDGSLVATGNAVCFLPGTFDVTLDGADSHDLQPSSHCGHDAVLRIAAFGEIAAGDEVARVMSLQWTDLSGRVYTLRFDGRSGDTSQARVVCLDNNGAGCRGAMVDSTPRALAAADGRLSETGARARLTLVADRDVQVERDLGVYDVPFSLAITGG